MPCRRFRQFSPTLTMVAAVAALGACRSEPHIADHNAQSAINVAAPPPADVVMAPGPPLDRAEIIVAAIRARSAAATGRDDRADQQSLENRRFSFRIRLGCAFAAADQARAAEASFDPEARRVTLSAAPDISADIPFVALLAGEGVEAAEGFWVPRPWLLEPACAGAVPADAIPQFGLVQYYTAEEPRTARRDGRPYQAAITLAEGEMPAAGAWDLVLTGRLVRGPGGRVIGCRAPAEGAMPSCLVSARFDTVTIEDNRSGQVVERWGRG